MGRKAIDLTGKVFGRLTILCRVNNTLPIEWICQCSCGSTPRRVRGSNLKRKDAPTRSCGCFCKERLSEVKFIHGQAINETSLYRTWKDMKCRCLYPSTEHYENYGGRGITVCGEWSNSFLSFRDWSMVNGWKDGLQLDRIDNNGNYCPKNCRWVTPRQNCWNKTNSLIVEYNGDKLCLAETVEKYGILKTLRFYQKVYRRIHRDKWNLERALLTE